MKADREGLGSSPGLDSGFNKDLSMLDFATFPPTVSRDESPDD